MERSESSMVLLAIFVSRFEAEVVAAMLSGYGLHVQLDAIGHASVEYISLALGGHRLTVAQGDYAVASDILRDCNVTERGSSSKGPSSALLKLLGAVGALYTSVILPAVLSGVMPALALLYIPLSVLTVPVDPKGRPDYFLAGPLD